MRLDQALNRSRTPVQARFGTVTAVNPGICTVKVAGGEIPVIYLKGGAPSVGDFVRVHRQGVVSYLLNPSSGALWVGDSGNGGAVWRVPTSGQNPAMYRGWYDAAIVGVVEGPDTYIYALDSMLEGLYRCQSSGPNVGVFDQGSFGLTGAAVTGICVGPDKNLWVSDSNGGVWKVVVAPPGTPFYDSTATFYPLTGSQPGAVCAGSDGNLWVLDEAFATPSVWRVTTSGTATQFLLASWASPGGIALGPDGNIWVADLAGYVWRVTPTGVPTAFPVGIQPMDLCAGPQRSLWVVDTYDQVLEVTTDGTVVAAFPMPGGSQTQGSWNVIALGPDGNLWMPLEYSTVGGYAVKMTPTGTVSLYELSPTANPDSICSGP